VYATKKNVDQKQEASRIPGTHSPFKTHVFHESFDGTKSSRNYRRRLSRPPAVYTASYGRKSPPTSSRSGRHQTHSIPRQTRTGAKSPPKITNKSFSLSFPPPAPSLLEKITIHWVIPPGFPHFPKKTSQMSIDCRREPPTLLTTKVVFSENAGPLAF
jgi:hypothetical protein